MSRWQPDARERLERAAMELFVSQGFAETTVAQITARAGLTTRTFFRHFSDKREVLFASEGDVPALAARMIAEAPASLSPMAVVAGGLESVAAARFGGGVEQFRRRRAVIESDDGLREREAHKLVALSAAVERGFRGRGVDGLTAALVAQVTVTVFSVSVGRWLSQDGGPDGPGPEVPLAEILHDTLRALRVVLADPGWSDPGAPGSAEPSALSR